MIFLINVGFSRLYFRSYRYQIQNSGQYKNVTHPENTGNIKPLLSYKYPRLPAAPPLRSASCASGSYASVVPILSLNCILLLFLLMIPVKI